MVSKGEKQMKIISVNAGSSSLKFKVFEMPQGDVLSEGVYERITQDVGTFKFTKGDETLKGDMALPTHAEAVNDLLRRLLEANVVASLSDIQGVGHRVVHGGEAFASSVVINKDVLHAIASVSDLAPLHNPANMIGIESFTKALPHAVQVAVFDTAFHQTMKEESFMYATPYEWYERYKVRKYGFHGTSHLYVSRRAAQLLGKSPSEVNVIVAHIGNGASICAIEKGKSVETTMGLTPLAGIPMGTRSGDIDPAIISFIAAKEHKSVDDVISDLNKKSGFIGVSGVSSDNRDLETAAKEGNHRAALAMTLQNKAIADTMAQYIAYMNGVDAICFTAGLGENSSRLREQVIQRLAFFGVKVDPTVNQVRGVEADISTPDSTIKVYLIPTNEEWIIAEDTYSFISQ
jgi:acetate kinase